jgi:hypothetical protein
MGVLTFGCPSIYDAPEITAAVENIAVEKHTKIAA